MHSTTFAAGSRGSYSLAEGNSLADTADSTLSWRIVLVLMLAATAYQTVLCFVHTNLFGISTATVALTEFVIYLVCFALLMRKIRLDFVAIATLLAAYLLLMAVFRSSLDFKGFRDLMIPILFYWIGRSFGNVQRADRVLKIIVIVVLVFGFFELFLVDVYSRIFNVFSYYINQSGSAPTVNWAKGSTLALNGMRPEGIGRTILPDLLGSHRVSSLFLEPVSLGNFAVIIAGWGLSKNRKELKTTLFFLVSAAIMITMADSRYGLVTIILLLAMRAALHGRANIIAIAMPLLSLLILIAIPFLAGTQYGDNIVGRLFISGRTLLRFGTPEVFGMAGFSMNFGDMGYATIFTRFGAVLVAILWIAFWLIRMQDERGRRFRAYVSLYITLILMISGTSLFALKTAGLLWFLIGCSALKETTDKTSRLSIPGKVSNDTANDQN